MADVIYNSAKVDFGAGNIDWDADTFKVMLVSSSYVPNQDTHTKRSDITNEVTGTNWAAGGVALANKSVTQDNTNNWAVLDADDISVASATFTGARGAVIYKSRGGASSADEILRYVDFGADKSPSAGTFTITWDASGVLRIA